MTATFILAGGPSLDNVDLSLLAGQHVIAVNRSYEIYPQADVHFFADCSFFGEHRDGIAASPIPRKVTCCKNAADMPGIEIYQRSKQVPLDRATGFVSNTNSGIMAANWAFHNGFDLAVFLGLDMRETDGRKHWHDGYAHSSKPKTCDGMLAESIGIRDAAWKWDNELLHGTPGSALTEIDYVPLPHIISNLKSMDYFGGWWLPKGEIHFREMLSKSKPAYGRKSYQYWNKLLPALEWCKSRRMAVDVGANVGFWGWHLAREFESVVAFEPAYEHACCHDFNMLGAMNYALYQVALGTKDGEVDLLPSPGDCGNTKVAIDGDVGIQRVAMNKLDSFMLDCDFLKIDCEGYELPILQGAVETIKRCRPCIVVEQKPGHAQRYGLPEIGAVTFLESLGAKQRLEVAGDYVMSWD